MANYSGTEGDDTYTGTAVGDTIAGNGGNDTLVGGDGDDQIDGGDGSDELTGGLGNDTLIGRGGVGNVDVAVFAGNYADYEILTGSTTTVRGLGSHAGDGTDTLLGIEQLRFADITISLGINPNNPPVLGEPKMADQAVNDGSNYTYQIPATAFIELDATQLTFTAKLADGSPLPSWLTFDGSTRTFAGVPPVSVVGTTYDIVVTAADQYSDPSEDFGDYQISDNFLLTINLAGGPDITGTDGDDFIHGTFREEDLIGLYGNDRLYGSALADRLDGGADWDTVDYSASPQEVTVNLGSGSASGGDAQGDLLFAIEGVIGSAFGDSLTGSLGTDTIIGGAGDDWLLGSDGEMGSDLSGDTLKGGSGNDTLDGGAGLGIDRLYGGSGDDTYIVTDAADYAYENAAEGTDRVLSSISHTLRVNVENLTLTGTGSIYGKGNVLANVITGNANDNKLYGLDGDDRLIGGWGNDTLDGGLGLDKMFGGQGDDVYIVESTTDQLVEAAAEGHDLVKASVTRGLGANFEDLLLIGGANINGTGNSLDNVIIGNSGANVLRGGLGDDEVVGQGGADVVKGEDGNDWLQGGAGRDRYYGGTGADEFVFLAGDFAGLTSSTCDQIHDFSAADGDRIRLNLVDANSALAGDQTFAFIGTGAFTGTAGELRYAQISGNTYVQGDLDGDGNADFWIRLDGLHALANSDFVL